MYHMRKSKIRPGTLKRWRSFRRLYVPKFSMTIMTTEDSYNAEDRRGTRRGSAVSAERQKASRKPNCRGCRRRRRASCKGKHLRSKWHATLAAAGWRPQVPEAPERGHSGRRVAAAAAARIRGLRVSRGVAGAAAVALLPQCRAAPPTTGTQWRSIPPACNSVRLAAKAFRSVRLDAPGHSDRELTSTVHERLLGERTIPFSQVE